MTIEPRTLSQMQNRPTAYEVVLLTRDGLRHRLGFTQRRGKRALLAVAQQDSKRVLELLGADADTDCRYMDGEWQFGDVCRLIYSGKTERDFAAQ